MRHIVVLCLLVVSSLFTSRVHADVIHQESFEGCNGAGYSLESGSFVHDLDDGLMCGGATNALWPNFPPLTGFQGSDYIALEDLVGLAATYPASGINNPNALLIQGIDIAGYADLEIGFLFAAPNAGTGRYETNDLAQLQYRIDGGAWVTVVSI